MRSEEPPDRVVFGGPNLDIVKGNNVIQGCFPHCERQRCYSRFLVTIELAVTNVLPGAATSDAAVASPSVAIAPSETAVAAWDAAPAKLGSKAMPAAAHMFEIIEDNDIFEII